MAAREHLELAGLQLENHGACDTQFILAGESDGQPLYEPSGRPANIACRFLSNYDSF